MKNSSNGFSLVKNRFVKASTSLCSFGDVEIFPQGIKPSAHDSQTEGVKGHDLSSSECGEAWMFVISARSCRLSGSAAVCGAARLTGPCSASAIRHQTVVMTSALPRAGWGVHAPRGARHREERTAADRKKHVCSLREELQPEAAPPRKRRCSRSENLCGRISILMNVHQTADGTPDRQWEELHPDCRGGAHFSNDLLGGRGMNRALQ